MFDNNSFVLIEDVGGDISAEELDRLYLQSLKREVVDSYAVHGEKIAMVKQLAIHLRRQKSDLICEGLDLVLEKYRDQLGELPPLQLPSGAAIPENGPPSK